ncbi:MAG: Omp28-related outer membrane protein [Chitinophagales bacterium]|nr:Omp28-related outer membrane protein [Chitinophagales bacterium]
MKKISILLIAMVVFIATKAQNVSTTPANKTVVLEEFTGQTCQYCPDGHKIANDLAKANAGKIFLINIHSGGYAAPSTSYPLDLRTTVGTTIDGSAGISGYPAGSVNRVKSPWASNRGAWAGEAASILAESSPVNVWCKSSVDKDTRLLTTEVEVYYTGNGTGTSNKLTVAVLQDGILGDQVGGTTWNPSNYVNGKYVHNHVLRMHQTPTAWGASLDTLTAGKLYKRTYVSILPATIGNVPLDIYSLKVVAFVAEGNNKILTGYETEVTHNNPNLIDLSLKDSSILPIRGFMEPETKWCDNKVTPRVVVTNNSATVTATSFTVTATVNGVATPKSFSGSLAPGQRTVLTWNEIQANASGIFSYKVEGFTNINGGSTITDNKVLNNSYSTNLVGIKPNAFTNLNVDMETTPFSNAFIDASENSAYSLVTSTAGLGAESSKNSWRLSLHSSWGVNGKGAHLVMGEANFIGVTNPTLSYYYAFSNTGEESSSAPTIKVSYSTDCGTNWVDVDTKNCQITGTANPPTSFYVPTSAEYQKVDVNLSALIGKKCLVRVSGLPGNGGNALYIDQISLKSTGGSGGGGGGSSSDTFHVKAYKIATATKTDVDIIGAPTFMKDSNYTWKVTNVTIPSNWTFLTICDPAVCVNYPATQRASFKATGNPTTDIYKITIDHKRNAGYGYVMLKSWKGKDSTSTTSAKDLKFSLLASTASSITLVSDASDKLLYFFDNKIFVDRDFNGAQLEVYNIKGQQVLNAKVTSDNIDFSPLTNGIYIARVSKDGQVLKSHKFNTSK